MAKLVNWETEDGQGFCMWCGTREFQHSNENLCPNPQAGQIGQPLYLNQLFEPQVLKGRTQFKPAHFKQRAL